MNEEDLNSPTMIGVTGHRPAKLGGYGNTAQEWVRKFGKQMLAQYTQMFDEVTIISGMALGFDQAMAGAAYESGTPFIAAIPFEGQELKWPVPAQRIYHDLLKVAQDVVVVSAGLYSDELMRIRNEWIVNHSDQMWALWDGNKDGGTAHCVGYARGKKVPVLQLWNSWLKYNGLPYPAFKEEV